MYFVHHWVSVTAVVLMQPVREKLCVCRLKQMHIIWPSESRCISESLRLLTTEQHYPNVRNCATHFMDDRFVNLGEYKAGYTKAI